MKTAALSTTVVVSFLSLLAGSSGCRFDSTGLVSSDGGMADVFQPDSTPDAAPACDPGASRCISTPPSRVETCEDGDWKEEVCQYGCLSEPQAHCAAEVVFQNGVDYSWLESTEEPGIGDLVVSGSVTVEIDTTVGQISGTNVPDPNERVQRVVEQSSSFPLPDILVMCFSSIQINPGATLRVVGERPLVLCASGQIAINGTVDAGAHGTVPGPAGYLGGSDGAPGEGAENGGGKAGSQGQDWQLYKRGGGGGAGHLDHGGPGGDAGNASGGSEGTDYGSSAINHLVGGSGGGSGADAEFEQPGAGGAGGGALMLASLAEIYVGPAGAIDVGGGGGRGAATAGGGGGSGGSLLLEAPLVTVVGVLAANGGGGGGSNAPVNDLELYHGEDGHLSGEAASGANSGGEGGAGLSFNGKSGTNDGDHGGGGGGSCGRIRINSNYEVQLEENGEQGTISPDLTDTTLFGRLGLAQ